VAFKALSTSPAQLLIDAFSPQECANYFAAAGYDPDCLTAAGRGHKTAYGNSEALAWKANLRERSANSHAFGLIIGALAVAAISATQIGEPWSAMAKSLGELWAMAPESSSLKIKQSNVHLHFDE
jgi:hypothetical protein